MDGYVKIGTMIDTKDFDAQIDYIEQKMLDIEDKLEKADMGFEVGDTMKLEAEYERLGNQLLSLKEKQEKYNQAIREAEMSDFSQIKGSIDDIGVSMGKITKKVVKWGLAIFGIRGIYMGIRQAVSQLLAEDENLKYQIDYIKWSVGQAIKPIIEFIVNLVYKIVGGVGAIIKLLFGINIFSKATASNFKNANANAGKLRKTLAGFDEMNILNQDGSTGILGDLSGKDLSAEVDTVANKLKDWWKNWTRMPSKEEWVGMFNQMIAPWKKAIDYLKEKVWDPFMEVVEYDIEMLRPLWEPVANEAKRTIDEIIKPAWEELKTFISEKTEQLRPIWEPVKNEFIKKKNEMLRAFAPFINTIIDAINEVGQIFGWHLDYIQIESEETGDNIDENIGGALNDVEGDARNLSNQQFDVNINTSNISNASNGISDIWNNLKNLVSRTWNVAVNYVTEGGRSLWGSIRSTFGFAKGGIVVPKLASGGIINQPGRGVPIGSAVGGERGMEGVIPLTDSQQMALLGEAIGKYININATIPVYVGNRQLARELRKIDAEDNFAYNR